MQPLSIVLTENRAAFEPGEEVSGNVSWSLDKPPRAVELRLFWFTRGKGTEDAGIVERVRYEPATLDEAHLFRFRLPEAPYSFSGKLISLVWALELVVEPGKQVTRQEIIVAPGAQEVRLDSADRGRVLTP